MLTSSMPCMYYFYKTALIRGCFLKVLLLFNISIHLSENHTDRYDVNICKFEIRTHIQEASVKSICKYGYIGI